MRILYILGLIITCPIAWAQDASALKSEAHEAYEKRQFIRAGELYEEAFKLEDASATEHYAAAKAWSMGGMPGKAVKQMHAAADKGFYNHKWLSRDDALLNARKHEGWEKVIDRIKLNEKQYNGRFNQPLKDTLETIYNRDQVLRQMYVEAQEKFGVDSDMMNSFWNIMAEVDRKNEEIVTSLIDKHGWPGTSEVGGKANAAVFLVFQHAHLDVQEKYLPVLRESVRAGESNSRHYAMMLDRVRVGNGKPQVYGTQFHREESGKNVFYPIEDPEMVNKRRAEIGMGPLEEVAEKYRIDMSGLKGAGKN